MGMLMDLFVVFVNCLVKPFAIFLGVGFILL